MISRASIPTLHEAVETLQAAAPTVDAGVGLSDVLFFDLFPAAYSEDKGCYG